MTETIDLRDFFRELKMRWNQSDWDILPINAWILNT